MSQTHKTLFSTVLFIIAFGGASARADERRIEAQKLFAEGQRHYKQQRYDAAIRLFLRAHGLWSHRSFLYNIALAYALKNDPILSVTYLRRYLEKAKGSERKPDTELVRARQQVCVLLVTTTNPNALIHANGRLLGRHRAELVAKPGKVTVMISIQNRAAATRTFVLTAGKKISWNPVIAALVARPAAPPSHPSPPGLPTPQPVRLDRKGLGRLHFGYFVACASLTAASALAALATSVKAVKLNDRYVPGDEKARKNGIRTMNAANALWGVSGGLAVGVAVLAIFTRWKGKAAEQKATTAFQVFPDGAGLSVQWSR
ncbi:MAG: hypothetical protein JW741_16730 [Sedimentisphaerales bacterium]|nr:hypothetical protein [Sedimentisphaerales bacterium]